MAMLAVIIGMDVSTGVAFAKKKFKPLNAAHVEFDLYGKHVLLSRYKDFVTNYLFIYQHNNYQVKH